MLLNSERANITKISTGFLIKILFIKSIYKKSYK